MRANRLVMWIVGGWFLTAMPSSLCSPAAKLHVNPSGRDTNPGTQSRPFQSLERARDEIRRMKREGAFPEGGVEVLIGGGDYRVRQTFRLTAEDSGTAQGPIRYRSDRGGVPRFTGGIELRQFRAVTDPAVLDRLSESARGQVLEVDLEAEGVTNLIPFELGGFSSGRGFKTHPAMELFVDGKPMIWARWPNEGFVHTAGVPGPTTQSAWDGRPGTPEGRFQYEGDRPARWVNEPDPWLYGYWFWDWADSYEHVAAIDIGKREITLAKPWHGYGYRKGQRYFALNLLCELDAPGEWYLDREHSRLYLYPPHDLTKSRVELTTVPFPLVELSGVSHVRFEGLLWELGAADGVIVREGEGCAFAGCTIRRMAGNGVEIRGGRKHTLLACDIYTMGRGGTVVTGGDRQTLTPGEHRVENCHIHHLSRIDHTYTPGVWLEGVGHRIRHNLIHDVASSALRVEGNEHLIEFNEIHRVVLESDDQGGADMFGNATYRGNVYRHNYWHHLGNWDRKGEEVPTGQAGIRLDDAICGVVIEGNIFQRCSAGTLGFGGVQIHGGKENLVEGNLFVDCGAAVSFSPWGEKRWREFVAQALDHPAIDRELYLRRYPTLARLAEDHDRNTIRRNVAVRCQRLLLRDPERSEVTDNREWKELQDFREGPDGRLLWDAAAAQRLGVSAIPFAQIGLQDDAWRNGKRELHPD